MNPSDTQRAARVSRWVLLIAATTMAAALAFSAWRSFAGVRDASRTLARGQGDALVESVQRRLRRLRHRPTVAEMQAILNELSTDGLRYLALAGRDPREVGTARGGVLPHGPPRGNPRELIDVGARIRIVRFPQPPPGGPGPRGRRLRGPRPGGPRPGDEPPGFGPPPHDDEFRPLPPRRGRRPHLPPLVIEFEPIVANLLTARARSSLLFSGSAAVVLFCAGLFAFLWLRRRELLELERARERHLATLGEMSAVLAHEIRNPLASLKGHAQLLAESMEDDERRPKVERIVGEAVRLENLTTGLLAFVRTGAIDKRDTDPVEVLQNAASEVDSLAVKLDTELAPSRWSMDGDRMQQVLVNVIRNAVQASPGGADVHVQATESSGKLLYIVRDRGAGIDPGDSERIFEAFHTSRTRGTGLGLAVAKRVVELHGGKIGANNHPEGGAVFRIAIPK